MFSRRSFLSNVVLLAAGAGAVWLLRERVLWAPPQPSFATGGSTGWLPFASDRAVVPTVRAEIEGRRINALIDSGAQYSAIDRGFAEALGLRSSFAPLVAVGVSGQPQLGRGVSADVSVGGLRLEDLKAAVLELGPIAGPRGLSAPLILGQDVLRGLVADIDFPGRRMMLLAADAHVLPQTAQAAPTRLQGRALAVQVSVGDTPLEVTVDTGASAVLALTRQTADSLGLLTGQKPRTAASIVLGGAVRAQVITAPEVTFAGHTYEDVDVMIFDAARLPGFPRGLLGAGALERFRTILNHAEGQIHLV
ncbi:MAG TPA: aspartyl protease family protein [Caulobacteraceae bacterium]|nr:aspartyl protease family protein [Caulobacteraceae bacterium]